MKPWSNLAKVVYKRTYARKDTGKVEDWNETVARVVNGNLRIVREKFNADAARRAIDVESDKLIGFMNQRKTGPAGRGYWFSGAPAHERIGGVALNNCWFVTAEEWETFVIAMDLLMLGGGVGLSVEHRYTSKLPRIKKDVQIVHKATKDADYIVPDSREGWCELFRRVLESYFVTGKSFTYSTVCIRGYGESIAGFGGTASGPIPLIAFIEKVGKLLGTRAGKAMRPLDAADLICATGEMVVAGNVRRSAIIILGDAWDKDYLKAKRWDLGPIPSFRSTANYSVVCDDIEDLHPLFWKTYEQGEPFGIINRTNIQRYGRMGEERKDSAVGVNPCAEATLEPFEPCNLAEQALANITDAKEFIETSRLAFRYAKRVTLEHYHHEQVQRVIERNRRVGVGITGCLERPDLFNPEVLNDAYNAIQAEDERYSKELNVPRSIRTTVIKPSGTMSKVLDCRGEGVHAAFSRYMIQRVRFSSNDPLIPLLKEAGHYMEPELKLDGTVDHGTLVVDFYLEAPEGMPCADEGFDTWRQLDTLLMAQRYWADQAVSVTVYYRKSEIEEIKTWLGNNLKYLKTISFLCHNDHGFKQAPKEAITEEQYRKLSAKVKNLDASEIVGDSEVEGMECEGGVCPRK
jgi:ribonucleoside-triphosphate reductase